jgi:uncharacterized protein YdaU (DUF1376 family)
VNYYRHHLGDYAKDTAGLSLLEHGAYRLLLDSYYSTERPIAKNHRSAYRICSANSPAERRAVDSVLRLFFTDTPDGYVNNRADAEIVKYQRLANKNRDSGRIGAAIKWAGERHSERHANVMANAIANAIETPSEKDGDTNSQQSINQETTIIRGQAPSKRFVPPSVSEVKAYCDERRNRVDPQSFVDHYTANGWMRGKTKLKDWRAAVRTWERNDDRSGTANNGSHAGGYRGAVEGPRVRSEGPTGLLAQLADELQRPEGDVSCSGG